MPKQSQRGRVGPVPRAICSLARKNAGAKAFARHARAFRGNGRRRRVLEIAHRLPADGGVRIEEPVDGLHDARLSRDVVPVTALVFSRSNAERCAS